MKTLLDHIVPALMGAATESGNGQYEAEFSLKTSTQSAGWNAEIKAGMPETCAVLQYKGDGGNIRGALSNLAIAVIMNRPERITSEEKTS